MTIQWTDINTPQWVSSEDYSFIAEYSSVFTYSFIFNDGIYAYSSYDNILDIYNITTQAKLASLHYSYYITSIFANNNSVFLGAKDEGVYILNKDVLSNFSINEDLYNATYLYKEYPDINSNYINFIHGNNECISFCSTSGVDFFKFEPNGYRSYTICSGADKCFLLSERELFYTVSGTNGWDIYQQDPISNWDSNVPLVLNSESSMALLTDIKSIKVSKDRQDFIYLFLLTDLGVCLINTKDNSYIYIQ